MAGNFDEIIRQVMASLSKEHGPTMQTETHAPDLGIQGVPGHPELPVTRPTYPEINPGYPGPFLRDPGELDPWEERYGV